MSEDVVRRPNCDKNCLEHLEGRYMTPEENPFYRAMRNEHPECFRYAQRHEHVLEKWMGDERTIAGKLEFLRYAHKNGCPWDEDTCEQASTFGNLDCLRYAHENGCPWNSRVIYVACHFKNLDCLHYALEHGCPSDPLYLPIRGPALPILYHHDVVLPQRCASELGDHIREHAHRGWLMVRCAVRWLRAYNEACSRVYSPEGVGFRMAETSFLETSSRERGLKI